GRDLREMALHGCVRLLEALLHRVGELVAELGQLGERALEVFSLEHELLEPRLLTRVLLRGQRIDLPESLAPTLQTSDLGAELLDLLVRERLRRAAFWKALDDLLTL